MVIAHYVMATITEMLDEARVAYHDLQTGKAVASVRDSNGEEVRYSQANRADLLAYIRSLEIQLNPVTSAPDGPLRFSF